MSDLIRADEHHHDDHRPDERADTAHGVASRQPRRIPLTSLRSRFVVGVGLILLPLVASLAIGRFLFLRQAIGALNEVVHEAIQEMAPLSNLEARALRVRDSLDRYLLYGDPADRELFSRWSDDLERAFRETTLPRFHLKEEREVVRRAYDEWRQARSYVLFEPPPVATDPATAAFDSHMGKAVDLLREARRLAEAEVRDEVAHAEETTASANGLAVGAALTGLLMSLVAALALSRAVLRPTRLLTEGAARIEHGDLSHRVNIRGADELSTLARTFNTMAEALQKDRQSLAELATSDELTGLRNRREFLSRLDAEIARSVRYGRPAALLLADLDHFKAINDTHGHPTGDRVLAAVAATIQGCARPADTAARVGGEEFTLLLPETDLPGARAMAERIRKAVENQTTVSENGEPIRVTISIGIAAFPESARSAPGLIEAADDALYNAKDSGRNCVRGASRSVPHPSALDPGTGTGLNAAAG